MALKAQQNPPPRGSDWERRTLLNQHLRVEVLPELGGKLSSITLQPSGGELLQPPFKPYATRSATIPFDQADGSGWDECLPSIGPCTVNFSNGRTANVTDHGDFWRLAWEIDDADATALRMHADGTSLPLRFERNLRLDGRTLLLDYTLHNASDTTVPYGWSVHPLFAIEPFDRIHLPGSVRQVAAASSANGRLGAPGRVHPWPMTTDANDGEPLDLAEAGSINDGVGDKLVLPSPAEGWCALERKTLRILVTLRFDPKDAPWLGLWLCYGGWPGGPTAKKGYTIALEPCNLPDDSLAASLAKGAGAQLAPGATKHWSLRLEIGDIQER